MSETLKRYLDSTIPSEVRDLARWCNWRYIPRAGKPPAKEPIDGASSTDPRTWLSYDEARDRFVASQANGQDIAGLWLATGPVEPDDELWLAGLDLDHCVTDEVPSDRAYAIINELGTYAEYSPGDGIRLLCWVPAGTRSIKRESEGFEFYSCKRWLSITGKHSFRTPRQLATLDGETPRRLYERWIGATPTAEKRKPRGAKQPKPQPKAETGSSGRRFEDSGVPVDRMVAVAKRCLKLLADERAKAYSEWVNVLCSLKWIEEQTEDATLAKQWHKFSKRCPDKYDAEDAQRRWDSYEAPPDDQRLTIGSLLRWASEDSGTAIGEIVEGKRKSSSSSGKKGRKLVTLDAADVTVEPIKWLWHSRIPRGKLSLIVGDMGDGKSFVTCDFAARISNGNCWPDGSKCPQGRVLLVNTEDAASDTIVPRLLSAGCDVSRRAVKIYHAIENEEGETVRLNLSQDLPLIEQFLIEHPDTQMVVIDPLASFAGERDFNSQNMYQMLGPLQEIASRHQAAIIGVVHLNKSDTRIAKYRVSGSTAILAAARCAWIVLRDPDNEDHQRRLLLPLKMNNSDEHDLGLAFRIESPDRDTVAHIEWSDETIGDSADDVLKRAEDNRSGKRGSNSAAAEFLRELLKDGPVPSTQVEEEAKQAGTSISACRKQKDALGIVVRKMGMGEGWCWMFAEQTCEDDN